MTVGQHADLAVTDKIAAEVIRRIRETCGHEFSAKVDGQFKDNLMWIGRYWLTSRPVTLCARRSPFRQSLSVLVDPEKAEENKMVVGSQARILYTDAQGRCEIALAFNTAVRDGIVSVIALPIRFVGLTYLTDCCPLSRLTPYV